MPLPGVITCEILALAFAYPPLAGKPGPIAEHLENSQGILGKKPIRPKPDNP